jgi:NAD+ kinase
VSSHVQTAAVFTHRRPDETAPAITALLKLAAARGVTLLFSEYELEKHVLDPGPGIERLLPNGQSAPDVCVALGGDGTILSALRRFAGTGVPVFGVNYGEIGFLSAVERRDVREGIERAFARDFEVVALPGISARADGQSFTAINDVSVQRMQGQRVANLAYSVGSDEVGRVRCDGLVVATPVGSTGYNLANGGPVMAWGVAGIAVSFIAPHSLTARALVVAPSDTLTISNLSDEEDVEIAVDGRPVGVLARERELQLSFVEEQGLLAQIPGTNFYQRLRAKFGRLATAP